jgi:ankyrin repeat protein
MSRPGSRPADEDQLLAVGRSLTKSRGLHFQLPIRRTLDTPNDDEGDATPGRHDVREATDHDTMDNSDDEGDTTPGQYDVQKAIDHDNTDNSDGESSPVVLTPDSGLSEDEDQGLVSTERSAIQSYQTNTSTPLDDSYKAISRGDIATVRKHLAANMIPCCKNNNGYTPLIIALLESQLEMAKFLLENGASVHQRVNNIPPIIWAVMKPHLRTQFMRILLDHGALLRTTSGTYPYNALHWAVKEGILEAVKFLLEEGMDTEAVDCQGHTTLWLAAEFGHIDVLELLLAKGAKLDHRGLCSETVLSWAVCHDQADVVKCLFDIGISLDDCDDLGISK